MTRRHASLATLTSSAVLAATLVGCSGAETEPDARPGPATSASEPRTDADNARGATTADAVPEELRGTWLLDIPRAQVGDNLEKAGFGKLVDRFYKSEGLEDRRTTLTMTMSSDEFTIIWRLPDKSWRPGWYGPAKVENGVLHLADDYYEGVVDSYRPTVRGDELMLRFVKTNVAKVRGIPSKAYSAAYFAQPWTRVDCTPDDLDACL